MKAIIYCRKSTDRSDRQQLSIDSQESEAMIIAEREWLEVIRVFKETKSAKAPWREKFNEMMALISTWKADCIITWKLNRLARNPVDEGTIKWSIQNGIIKAIFTESENFRTWDNVLIMWMHFGMSTQYILDLQKDIKRGIKNKIKNWWVCQKAPLGYINNRIEKIVEIDYVKCEWVKLIFELRIQKMAYWKIGQVLFERGMGRNKDMPFPANTIETIVKNKFYIWMVNFSGVTYKWNYETFISEKTFKEANSLYQWFYEHKDTPCNYPLKWILRDSEWIMMNGYIAKWKYTYYKSQTKSPINVNINEKLLFEKAWELLESYEMKWDFKALNKKMALRILEENNPQEKKKLLSIEAQIWKLKAKKQNLLDLRLEEEIDKAIYNEKSNEIVHQISTLENQRKEISQRKDSSKINKGVELACSLYRSYKEWNEEKKSNCLKSLRVELFLNTKKELSIKENSLLKFINFLNFQNGGT